MKKQPFTLPENFPTARKESVIMRQVSQGSLTTETGIIIAETASNVEKPNVGQVYAVGPGVLDDLKPGMRVYYNQYANLEILINGIPYVMCSDRDVYAILKEDNRVSIATKESAEVRREKKQTQQVTGIKARSKKSANDLDKRIEGYKKPRK